MDDPEKTQIGPGGEDHPKKDVEGMPHASLSGINILKKLGSGGMGAVYLGTHPRLRSKVAIKILPAHMAQDPDHVKRFVREAQMAALVKSQFLVNVLDVNEENGVNFIVMEYVDGMTAGQMTKQAKPFMPEIDAVDVCIAATQGLYAAHSNGVIHRDIKPDNIMVPFAEGGGETLAPERSKLMDLGLAKVEATSDASLTMAKTAMGTAGYMAPEQAMDAKTADKRSDIFSMGATLYTMVAGQPPFPGESSMKIIMDSITQPHRPISQIRPVSACLSKIIDKCLHKEPARRYADATELLAALRACRTHCAAEAAKPKSSPRGVKLIVAGVVAVIAISGAWLGLTSRGDPVVPKVSPPPAPEPKAVMPPRVEPKPEPPKVIPPPRIEPEPPKVIPPKVEPKPEPPRIITPPPRPPEPKVIPKAEPRPAPPRIQPEPRPSPRVEPRPKSEPNVGEERPFD